MIIVWGNTEPEKIEWNIDNYLKIVSICINNGYLNSEGVLQMFYCDTSDFKIIVIYSQWLLDWAKKQYVTNEILYKWEFHWTEANS
jgi:hypothetical protein